MKKLISILFLSLLVTNCSKHNSSSTESSTTTPQAPGGFEVAPNPDGSTTPPTPPPTTDVPPTSDDPDNAYKFTLNDDATFTSGLELQIKLSAPVSVKSIKIGQTQNCSDGEVENFKSALTRPVFNRNAINLVSVQFISFSGAIGACLTKSIVQDDQAPEIIISQFPAASLEEGSSTEIKYSVKDISAIKQVICTLNDSSKTCLAGDGLVKIPSMSEGLYEFKINATDEHGFTSTKSVSWRVVNSIKKVNQVVDIKDDRKADILIVVDNSNSMEYEQKSMAKRVGNMLSVLKGLDWQIAVTTTDARNVALGDGRLIPIYGMGTNLFLKSTMDPNEAQSKLGMTLQRPEIGSSSEQPIRATYRFIERAFGADTAYRKFFRDNSNFAVVVISDEDESDNTSKNDPNNLIKLVSSSFNQQKVFSWHSIITKPGDKACLSTYGATYGVRLAAFSALTGGIVGSVCEEDYAKQMVGIANGIVNMNKSISLTCQPVSGFPITIKKDGADFKKSYRQEGLNLKFDDILDPGSYAVEYTCLK